MDQQNSPQKRTTTEYLTNSSQETTSLGEKLATTLKDGDVVCLFGNLGGGKTTFVQGIAKGLGITGNVNSPTFLIMKEYKAGEKSNSFSPSPSSSPIKGEEINEIPSPLGMHQTVRPLVGEQSQVLTGTWGQGEGGKVIKRFYS